MEKEIICPKCGAIYIVDGNPEIECNCNNLISNEIEAVEAA